MKLSDIIDFNQSLWKVLGQTGGTALPDNDKPVKVNNVDVWKKSPPHRTGKKDKRIDEYARGGEYDPSFGKFGDPNSNMSDSKRSWAKTTGGDPLMTGMGGKRKKYIIRRVGDNTDEVIDDEGNVSLRKKNGKQVTGDIDHKRMHVGGRRTSGGELPEGWTGAGAGSQGASVHPTPQPNTVIDNKRAYEEMKGKDTKAEAKTSKKKRETLKQYLEKRANGEIVRN